jgi:thiol:disulfide interchange protein DsbD
MKNILTAIALLVSFQSYAQTAPVSWSFEVIEDDGAKALVATATIDEGWVVYSPFTEEGGPVPTTIEMEGVELVGTIREEGKIYTEYSELFELNVSKFKNEVKFVQAFNPAADAKVVKGYLEFMTCDGTRCLPPKEVDFSIKL